MPTESQAHDQHEQDAKRPQPQVQEQNLREPESTFQPAVDPSVALQRTATAPPPAISPADILALQCTAGNRAVGRLLAQRKARVASSKMMVQPKLTVNPPGDRYEQEADHMASQVMQRMSGAQTATVQRQEEEEELQTKPVDSIQRAATDAVPKVDSGIENQINSARGGGESLPDNIRDQMEHGFSADFSGVLVHTDSEADVLNQQLSAKAFTAGHDIFFRQGEYSPGSDSGQKLVAHELTHVVQQTGGNKPQRQPVEEEVQMKLDTHKGELKCDKVNPEMESTLQRARGNSQPLGGVIQRMAVMAADNMNDQKDPLVWNNLSYAEDQAGTPIGDLKTNKVWDQLKNNEAIRIVGHGSKDNKIEGFTAVDIATSMKTTLPKDKVIKEVTFQSCHAGEKGISGTLVGDMKQELEAMNRHNVKVKGRTGIAFGFKGMGGKTAATTKGKYTFKNAPLKGKFPNKSDGFKAYRDAQYEYQNATTKNTKVPIFPKYLYQYNEPWKLVGKSKKIWDKWSPSKRGKKVSEEMSDYWAKAKAFMAKRGGFKPTADEILTQTTDVNPFVRLWRNFREMLPF